MDNDGVGVDVEQRVEVPVDLGVVGERPGGAVGGHQEFAQPGRRRVVARERVEDRQRVDAFAKVGARGLARSLGLARDVEDVVAQLEDEPDELAVAAQHLDGALVAAATLSNRYITSRQLPDKAIDLIDEAASRLRMELDSSPEELDILRRQVDRLKMEELHLSKESDAASVDRLERLRADLADKSDELAALTARWEAEKSGLNRVGDLKARVDELRTQADRLQREGDYESASRLLYGDIPAAEQELATCAAEAEA